MELDPMNLDIWLQLTIILAIAVLGHLIMSWIKQPTVVGELIIGIVLGPSVFGLITGKSLFDQETIMLFAHFGGIILLFLIGLETKLSVVGDKKAISVAFGGVVIPWAVGYFIAVLFGFETPNAIFIGATMTATSVGVTAMVLMEMNAVSTNIGRTIIGAAVVDDILAMIALSISEGIADPDIQFSIWIVARVSIVAVAFIVIFAIIGIKILNPAILKAHRLGQKRGVHSIGFMLALALALLYAFIAESIGLSAIIGSFLAGTVLEPSELKKVFATNTQSLGMVFIPVFFISLGLLVDLTNIMKTFVFVMVLTGFAVVTKIVGCGIPCRLFGDSGNDSFTVGYGMVPRGEIALVMALIGLNAGIISDDLYAAIVIMAILTTVVVPIPLGQLLKEKRPEDGSVVSQASTETVAKIRTPTEEEDLERPDIEFGPDFQPEPVEVPEPKPKVKKRKGKGKKRKKR
jgi:Kef-type K+ transport system membrane component KefB